MQPLTTIPKFQQLADSLTARLKAGEWVAGEKIPAERALASDYGVAHLTVNKAIAGLVAGGLLERRQGDGTYVRTRPASRAFGTRTVPVMLDTRAEQHDPFLSTLPLFLQARGLFPVLLNWEACLQSAQDLSELMEQSPSAFIAHGRCGLPPGLPASGSATRLIVVGNLNEAISVSGSYLLHDFAAGGQLAARHLLEQGCQRFLLIGSGGKDAATAITQDRYLQGASHAILAAGKTFQLADAMTTSEAAMRAIFADTHHPDAVISPNDFRLMATLKAARAAGRRTPDEVRGVGQFNTPWATTLGLSSVAMDIPAILAQVAEILDGGEDRTLLIPPTLVCRESSVGPTHTDKEP